MIKQASILSLFLAASPMYAEEASSLGLGSSDHSSGDMCVKDGLPCETWDRVAEDARLGLEAGIEETRKIIECRQSFPESPDKCPSDGLGLLDLDWDR